MIPMVITVTLKEMSSMKFTNLSNLFRVAISVGYFRTDIEAFTIWIHRSSFRHLFTKYPILGQVAHGGNIAT